MFPQQKERVARYWVSGAGCSKIATALGLSVNTVKSFCRRNSVEMHNQIETAPDKYMEVVCTDRCPQRNWFWVDDGAPPEEVLFPQMPDGMMGNTTRSHEPEEVNPDCPSALRRRPLQ